MPVGSASIFAPKPTHIGILTCTGQCGISRNLQLAVRWRQRISSSRKRFGNSSAGRIGSCLRLTASKCEFFTFGIQRERLLGLRKRNEPCGSLSLVILVRLLRRFSSLQGFSEREPSFIKRLPDNHAIDSAFAHTTKSLEVFEGRNAT